MAPFYKAFVSRFFDRLQHTHYLQHSGGARRVLQDVLIHASALRTGEGGGNGTSVIDPSPYAPTPSVSSGLGQFSNASSSSSSSSSSVSGVSHFSPSIAIIMFALLSAFFFLGFFTLYLRRCAERSSGSAFAGTRGSFRRTAHLQEQQEQGVDPEFVRSLPLIAYSAAKKRGNNIECVVCLVDFEEQEHLRQLPGCKHVFHPPCIDMWLFSHSTCPLCRRNIALSSGSFSLRWGGSGNIRQLLGGGGGSGLQPGLLGGGGGNGQEFCLTDSMRMIGHADVPESNDVIIRTSRGHSTDQMVAPAIPATTEADGNPSAGPNTSNFIQWPFAGKGASNGNQSARAEAGGARNLPPRSRAMLNMDGRRQQTSCLARANSTGHSLQVEASPLLNTTPGESSGSRSSSIYRSSSETVKGTW